VVSQESREPRVAEKLKYHRLKPGGVARPACLTCVATKLKYHRLKPVVLVFTNFL